MRNYAANAGLFPIFAAILISLSIRDVAAQEAVSNAADVSTSATTTTTTSTTSTGSTTSTSSPYSTGTTSPASPTGSAAIPVEQVGTGIFAKLPFKLSLSLRVGYDDNVTTSSSGGGQGSGYTNGSLDLSYNFGSPRTQITLAAGVGGTYYWETIHGAGANTNDYDISNHLSLSIIHKATPRLTLNAALYLTYQSEPDFSVAQGVNRRGGNYFYTGDTFAATYLWTPRFSTETTYSLAAIRYDNDAIGQFDNRVENTIGNEFRFLVLPTTRLVLEYRVLFVTYTETNNFDSTSQFALAGFDHVFNPRLSGTLRAGGQFRDTDQFGSESSPYFEASLNYSFSKRTSVTWNARYSIEEGDVGGGQGRKTFRTGLTGKYDFTPRISGSIGAYYSHDDYQSVSSGAFAIPGFIEDTFDLSLSVRYAVTRYFGAEIGYGFTDVSSDIALREYSRNRYWAGLNVIF
jgi:Putative beta-barrel porin 2